MSPGTRNRREARLARRLLEGLVVVAGLVAATIVIRVTDLDPAVSQAFYDPVRGWWASGRPPWPWIYTFGAWPANIAGILALGGWIGGRFRPGLRRHRRVLALLVLTLALGPGLIVNGILKNEAGRNRPRDVTEFGGDRAIQEVLDFGGTGRSFPSGHAASGFYFLVIPLILRRLGRARDAALALPAALLYGSAVSFQRIASGAHFLSDTIWAGGIVYLTALAIEAALPIEARLATPVTPEPRRRPTPGSSRAADR